MKRYLLLCRRNTKLKEKKEARKEKRVATLEKEKIVRQAVNNKENWGKKKEIKADHRKIEEIVPQKFLKQKKIFGKIKSERMPTKKIQYHVIDLKKMFKLQKGRIHLLFKNEKEEVQNFVNNQLRKGYIKLSKSLQMSPVFFVCKKNRSKRIVIDYCSLNKQTIKNNYLLLLITDLIDNIGSKKVFTKIDLQQGFNNVRIEEENEWKGVFTIYIGLFEPTVMFFRITNLLAIFQAMINKILRDLVNKGKVATFVDNMLVETETKKGYNEIVEKVLRRLKENNLYIKQKKCVQKVRKIGFLGVIIGPNGIEIEKKKVDKVLSVINGQ